MISSNTEAGFTLVELLISMLILSLGVVAVLGALGVGINSGWIQREMTRNELAAVGAGEALRDPGTPYISCPDYDPVTNSYPTDAGVEIVEIRFIQVEQDDLPPTLDVDDPSHFAATCPQESIPAPDPGDPPILIDVDYGLQAIFIRAFEEDGGLETTISIVKGDR